MKNRFLHIVAILCTLFSAIPHQALSRELSVERLLLQRMFHYRDSIVIDSITSNVYVRYHFHTERRNPILMCVPTLYHISYNNERQFVGESYNTLTFYGGKFVKSDRHIEVSTMRRNRNVMPNLLAYLTPSIYSENIINAGILSPFHNSNRFYYKYRVKLYHNGTALVNFRPRSLNTQTVKGYALIDAKTGRVITCNFEGEFDMVHFTIELLMGDEGVLSLIPAHSTLNARFNFLGNKLTAKHEAYFNLPSQAADTLINNHDKSIMEEIRPDSLTEEQVMIYTRHEELRQRNLEKEKAIELARADSSSMGGKTHNDLIWKMIGDNLVHRIRGNFGPDKKGYFRTSPLLNPLYLDYSDRRGVTYRFDVRGYYTFNDNQELSARIKLGYAFKQKQLYLNIPITYTFDRQHDGFVNLEMGFGKRISNGLVAQHVTDLTSEEMWEGISIADFRDNYVQLRGHYNVSEYFGVSAGLTYHRRKAIQWRAYEELGLSSIYHAFAPMLELKYRPLGWNGPILTADYERGVSGIFKSGNKYERWEFDASYVLNLLSLRYLSLRVGGGFYTTPINQYDFVDYTNFCENNLPSGWNDELSGEFVVLSRMWFNTSKHYFRANATYESPLLALSWLPVVGYFIEKERFYLNFLSAEKLKHYEEVGYGFTNRLFSLGIFVAFREGRYDRIGFTFGFELFNNW